MIVRAFASFGRMMISGAAPLDDAGAGYAGISGSGRRRGCGAAHDDIWLSIKPECALMIWRGCHTSFDFAWASLLRPHF